MILFMFINRHHNHKSLITPHHTEISIVAQELYIVIIKNTLKYSIALQYNVTQYSSKSFNIIDIDFIGK